MTVLPLPLSAAQTSGHQALLPEGWPPPRGYANGIKARGATVFLGGQIGWDARGQFAEGFVAQARQALDNIRVLLAEAGCGPQHLTRLTWFVVDMAEYRGNLKPLGRAYREVLGASYPAMSLVAVSSLVEERALVEIEATAVLPEG